MTAFKKFDPAHISPLETVDEELRSPGAAKAPKPAKLQSFRRFQPPKGHLKLAKDGGTLGDSSQTLAAASPQKTSILAGLATLAGPPPKRIYRNVLLQVADGVPEDWAPWRFGEWVDQQSGGSDFVL